MSTENGHHGWKIWWIRRGEIQVLLEKYLPKNTTEENKYGMELFDSKYFSQHYELKWNSYKLLPFWNIRGARKPSFFFTSAYFFHF